MVITSNDGKVSSDHVKKKKKKCHGLLKILGITTVCNTDNKNNSFLSNKIA